MLTHSHSNPSSATVWHFEAACPWLMKTEAQLLGFSSQKDFLSWKLRYRIMVQQLEVRLCSSRVSLAWKGLVRTASARLLSSLKYLSLTRISRNPFCPSDILYFLSYRLGARFLFLFQQVVSLCFLLFLLWKVKELFRSGVRCLWLLSGCICSIKLRIYLLFLCLVFLKEPRLRWTALWILLFQLSTSGKFIVNHWIILSVMYFSL